MKKRIIAFLDKFQEAADRGEDYYPFKDVLERANERMRERLREAQNNPHPSLVRIRRLHRYMDVKERVVARDVARYEARILEEKNARRRRARFRRKHQRRRFF